MAAFFIDAYTAKMTDLSGVRVLRCGVDTVRQLYNGLIRPEVIALFDSQEPIVEFAGYEWSKGRIGRDSGYQFRLQNADLGLILLIKNHNMKLESIGSHLKIEVSPHAIDGVAPKALQGLMDSLAAAVMTHCEPNQCAVHIALDVQGWTPKTSWIACTADPIGYGRSAASTESSSTATPRSMDVVKPTCSAHRQASSWRSTTSRYRPVPPTSSTTGTPSGRPTTAIRLVTATQPTTPSSRSGVSSFATTTPS